MASSIVISLIAGCGIAIWTYGKFQRSSGGNSKNSAIASLIVALLITVIGSIVLDYVFHRFK